MGNMMQIIEYPCSALIIASTGVNVSKMLIKVTLCQPEEVNKEKWGESNFRPALTFGSLLPGMEI